MFMNTLWPHSMASKFIFPYQNSVIIALSSSQFFTYTDTFSIYVLTLWKKISFLSLSASKHTILKKIGQHHFLHITSYMPILNIQVGGALSLCQFAQRFCISIYGNIRSVLPFRVNISSPEARRKKDRSVPGSWKNGHSHGIGAVVSSFVAFLPICSEIWTMKIFLHNTTVTMENTKNECVSHTYSCYIYRISTLVNMITSTIRLYWCVENFFLMILVQIWYLEGLWQLKMHKPKSLLSCSATM